MTPNRLACEQAQEWIAALWMRELDEGSEAKLRAHAEGCAECGRELSHLSAIWNRLADIPAPEPSQALHVRWQSTLDSLRPAPQPSGRAPQWRFTLQTLWPQRPVWQAGIAAGCLVLGLVLGSFLRSPAERGEVAKLREEVASTKEMVALSLLQQQSATERLRGVDYSHRIPSLDPQIVSALINAVQHDADVNVRLAAVDALARVANDSGVRQSLTRALPTQDSPMVQAALIDYMVDAKDKSAAATLRHLNEDARTDPTVRRRAGEAVRELTEFR